MHHHHPSAAMSAAGFCHNHPLTGHPVAIAPELGPTGQQQVPLHLGVLPNGRPLVILVSDPDYLTTLIDQACAARATLTGAQEQVPVWEFRPDIAAALAPAAAHAAGQSQVRAA